MVTSSSLIIIIIASRQSQLSTHKHYHHHPEFSCTVNTCVPSFRGVFSLVFRIFIFRAVQTRPNLSSCPDPGKTFPILRTYTSCNRASTINPFQISSDCKITINVLEETRRYSPGASGFYVFSPFPLSWTSQVT